MKCGVFKYVVALLLAATACATVRADSYTWNGGAGTWDTSATNWLSSGGSVAWPSTGTDNDGVFGGTASTVTLSGGVLANDLLFSVGGYTVSGVGTLTLNGTSPTVTVTTGSATIGNNTALVLAGSGGLTKAGAGTLSLSPSAVSTLTGGVTVTGGTLALSFANLATPTNLLPTANALSLANGAISVVGKPTAVLTSQTFAGLSVGSGLSAVALTRTSGTLQLDVGTVSQSAPGGIVSFQGSVTATSPVKVSNSINSYIGSWAVNGDPRTSAARWALVNGSGQLTTVTGSASGVNWANVTSATTVYTATNSVTLAANATAFGVQNNEAFNRTVTLGNFTFTTNGISKILQAGVSDTYTAGSGTGSIVVGAGNELVMMGVGNITISAPIVNGVSGSSAVTYVGGGTLQFDTKASTYTGPTTVNSGVVRIGSGGSINASSGIAVNGGRFAQANTATAVTPAVTLRSGTVDGTGTITTVAVADASTATVTNGDGTTAALTVGSLTFNGDGTINVNTAGSAGLAVTGALATTPANGTVTINVPTAPVWVTGSTYNLIGYGSWSGSVSDLTKGTIAGLGGRQIATLGSTGPTNGFVTLAITGDGVVWTGSTSNLWTTATTAIDWRLQAAGTPTTFIATDDVRFDDTATGSTTVDIANANVSPNSTVFDNSSKTYVISSGSGFGIASGVVTKNGSGLVRFDTANTYTGVTTINGGTLALNSGAAIANTGVVTFADAAGATLQVLISETIGTLSGGGTTGGMVDIAAGQTLTLSSGTQTYAGGVSGAGVLASAGALQTINGAISSSGGVVVSSGRLNLGGSNTYTGETSVAVGTAVVVTADGALGATGAGNGTLLGGSGGAVAGVLGLSGVNYTITEKVSGVGVGNTSAVSGLGAAQRGIVQSVSGSSRFAGTIEISGTGITRLGTQNGAVLNLAGSIAPAAGVTGVTPLFRAGDTNGDFVILSGTSNSWDTDTAVFTGNNTAGQYAGLRLGASNALPTNVGVYGSSSAGVGNTFDLNGFDQTLNGLTSETQPTGGVAQLRITNLTAGGTSTLTLDVTATRSTTVTTLQEVAGGGVLALVKTGTGTQSLGGTNTYSGRTTVSAGTLQFTKAAALYGGTAANWTPQRITVASGAILGLTVGGTTGEFTGSDVGTLATNLTTGLNNDGLRAGSFLGLNVAAPTTVSTVLADSVGTGGGAVGIVKSGGSTLTLDQANTFSGGLRVIDGYVVASNNAALGTGTTTLGAAAKRMTIANGISVAMPISVDVGAGSGTVGNGLIQNANAAAAENATVTGTITVNTAPANGGHFGSAGDGSTLTLAGPIISASTPLTQRVGTVVYAGGGSYASLDITGAGRLGANEGLSTAATVSLGLSGAGSLDLAGYSQTLVGLRKTGGSAATVGSSSTTSDSTLTIVGSSTFAGVIQDSIAGGTRTVGLVVNNPGSRFELSGANTYTGATTIRGGTLALGAGGSIASSPLIVVGDAGSTGSVLDLVGTGGVAFGASQVVGGSGTIAGAVTFGSGATVSPGNSPGTLTVGDVTFASGGNYNWQLFDSASTAGSGWDLMSGTGVLTITSSTASPFRINLWTLSGTGPDVNGDALGFDGSQSATWTIASFAGGILGFDPGKFTINTSAINGTGGFTNAAPGTFGVAQAGNALQVVYTAVPEPTGLALACAGGAAIGWIIRRRRR